MKIHFYLQGYYIYTFYTYNGKRYKESTTIKINPKEWNKKKERPKSNYKFYSEIKQHLDIIENNIIKAYFDAINKGNLKNLKNKISEIIKYHNNAKDLMSCLDDLIELKKNNNNLNEESYRKYTRLRHNLKKYKPNIQFKDINNSFFSDFINWLESKDFKASYIQSLVKSMRAFINYTNGEEITNIKVPTNFKYYYSHVDSIYLTINELEKLYYFNYKNKRLRNAINQFIFTSFTGMRFSNMKKFIPDKDVITIKDVDMIKVIASKSEEIVLIPLHPIVRKIIDDGFRPLSNVRLNEYIKEAAKLAGINDTINLEINKGGKKIIKQFKKYEKLTTHTGRRSFATNGFLANIQIKHLMMITGHKTESQFLDYIHIRKEENAIMLNNHPFFNTTMKVI